MYCMESARSKAYASDFKVADGLPKVFDGAFLCGSGKETHSSPYYCE